MVIFPGTAGVGSQYGSIFESLVLSFTAAPPQVNNLGINFLTFGNQDVYLLGGSLTSCYQSVGAGTGAESVTLGLATGSQKGAQKTSSLAGPSGMIATHIYFCNATNTIQFVQTSNLIFDFPFLVRSNQALTFWYGSQGASNLITASASVQFVSAQVFNALTGGGK